MVANSLLIFTRNIAGLRTHYGYSKKHMAKLLEISVKTLTKLENGIIPPRLMVDVVFTASAHFHIAPAVIISQELFPCTTTMPPIDQR